MTVAADGEGDARMIKSDIGNFEAPCQQRQPPDVSEDAFDH